MRLLAPRPQPVEEVEEIEDTGPSLQEKYEAFKSELPKSKDFLEGLNEKAGIAPDEEQELLDLIEQRLRLKRGG